MNDERSFSARAFDAQGRRISEGVEYAFAVEGAATLLRSEGARAVVQAGAEPGEARVTVVATEADQKAAAEALLKVVAETKPKRADAGVPAPEELNEPLAGWRSRSVGEKWQVNGGHSDYRTASAVPRGRVRYLAFLLAKEVISRNFPPPEVGQILEEMVGLLAALDRGGAWGKGVTRTEGD